MFRLGLIINPMAGIGGPLAMKGSDDSHSIRLAHENGAEQRAISRATLALAYIDNTAPCKVYCYAGPMGEEALVNIGLPYECIGVAATVQTTASDTEQAAKRLSELGMDLIVFVGGDGTARDVFRALGSDVLVLGIPAGVKMHSGVYAISPQGAGAIINKLIHAELVDVGLSEVRDIDEVAFREGVVKSQYYGELLVPREGQFLQQTKISGLEVEELVLEDIAADIIESMDADCLYLIGPGTTPRSILQSLNLDSTLLGVDALLNEQLLALDVDEKALLQLIEKHDGPTRMIITAIGGQGHIFGRGNQQLSPTVIRAIGIENIVIVATKTKIVALEGRPLLVDTNDSLLDEMLVGYRQVVTGYHDAIIYPVGISMAAELVTS